MEHMIVNELSNGFYSVKPESGYILVDKQTGMRHSDAVTKEPSRFTAVEE